MSVHEIGILNLTYVIELFFYSYCIQRISKKHLMKTAIVRSIEQLLFYLRSQ